MRMTAGAEAPSRNSTICSSSAPSSGADVAPLLRPVSGCLPFQIADAIFDQNAVPFPFDKRLLQERDKPLGLSGIATGSLQIRKQLLLVSQPPPTCFDILSSLEELLLLDPKLLGGIGGKSCHAAT
jgi:hypothetical protein